MTTPIKTLTARWLIVAAIAAHGAAMPAMAQVQAAARYDLPAQDLGTSLRAIAQQSRIEIIFADETVHGRRAPAIRGQFTPGEAVGAALVGSGLVTELRDGAILVRVRPGAVTASTDQADEVTITGTHIRGAGIASPLTVTTRQSLTDAGLSTMAEFSRVLTQNFAGGQNPGVAGSSDQKGYSNINNSTTLNLRGLGADATLTLINGHRLAYDGVVQGVDISAIPLEAIDRIEVIADGASALYGSDAVAGVVNFWLRRDFSGLRTSARLGAATEGGDVQQQYDIVTGSRWSGGGVMIAADYSHNSPVNASQRAITAALDGSQTLIARQSQESVILSGHQQIADPLSFELDAEFTHRTMYKSNPFSATAPASVNGSVIHPSVTSYAVTPSLRLALPAGWEATLSGTHSDSLTLLRTVNNSAGVGIPGRARYDNRLDNLEAGADGTLFDLPGGAARLALGGGYRMFQLDILLDQVAGGVRTVQRDAHEKRKSLFGYGELDLPLVGAANAMPLLAQLELSAALRYEAYRGFEHVATPKLGLIYAPAPGLSLKASWGRSFKIPTLNQANQAQSGGVIPAFFFAPQPTPPIGPNGTVFLLSGGNPGLRSERATTWTGTIELRPRALAGLTLTATFFHTDYRNRIATPINDVLGALVNPGLTDFVHLAPTTAQVLALIASLPQPIVNATGRPFDPSQVGAIIDDRLRNGARDRVQGVDLSADYRFDLSPLDRLAVTGSASYLDDNRQLIAGQAMIANSGVIFTAPHWRGRAGASWDHDRLQLSSYVNYTGMVRDNRLASIGKLSAFATVDLSASVRTGPGPRLTSNLEIRLSALNLFDRNPQHIFTSSPYFIPFDSTNQSAIGRYVSLSVSKAW